MVRYLADQCTVFSICSLSAVGFTSLPFVHGGKHWNRDYSEDCMALVTELIKPRTTSNPTSQPYLAKICPSIHWFTVFLHVHRGAVCQCWLSWVKQVRPGMLHVSLFLILLSNLRSFFFRLCSRSSHSLSFSCRAFLNTWNIRIKTPRSS